MVGEVSRDQELQTCVLFEECLAQSSASACTMASMIVTSPEVYPHSSNNEDNREKEVSLVYKKA